MIEIIRKIHVKNPILIASWPGMGHVAINAARYLKDKIKARLFAKIKGGPFFHQSDIAIHKGIINMADYPEGKFYFWESKTGANDIIIFLSEVQPPAQKFIAYSKEILDFAGQFNVRTVLTFAAILTSSEYTYAPKIWSAGTDKKVMSALRCVDVKPLKIGQISGLNGLLLGVAKHKNMQGICLLGEIPFYATQLENPRTSYMLLNVLSKYLKIPLDLSELSIASRIMEEEIGKFMNLVKKSSEEDEPSPIGIEDIERIKDLLSTQRVLPNSAKEEIEELFLKTEEDISYAMELKKKLDEWHVYREYEDRFLGLFGKKDQKG